MIDLGVINDPILSTFTDTLPVTVEGIADPVEAIYDSRYYDLETGEAGGSTLITSIAVRTSAANLIAIGATEIVARGISYVAKAKRPDGEGMTVVELEKAP